MNTFNKGANGFTETIRLLQLNCCLSFHVFVKLDGTPTHSQTTIALINMDVCLKFKYLISRFLFTNQPKLLYSYLKNVLE